MPDRATVERHQQRPRPGLTGARVRPPPVGAYGHQRAGERARVVLRDECMPLAVVAAQNTRSITVVCISVRRLTLLELTAAQPG